MSNLDSLWILGQANESSLGFQSWLIFGGFVINVGTVLVVQGGLYLAHRAHWWQSDGPAGSQESDSPLPIPTLAETEDLHQAPAAPESDQPRRMREPRRRSA